MKGDGKKINFAKKSNKIKILLIGTLMVMVFIGIIIGFKNEVLLSNGLVVKEKEIQIPKEETLVDNSNKSDTAILGKEKETMPLDDRTNNNKSNTAKMPTTEAPPIPSKETTNVTTRGSTPEPSIDKPINKEIKGIPEDKTETITSLKIQSSVGEYSDFERRVVELVNIERTKHGLKSLNYEISLREVAQVRAKEILTTFSHTRPNGTDCFTVFSDACISYDALGENLAFGQTSPEEVMEGWMSSAGHRDNILNPYLKGIVTCVEKGPSGELYWVQLFTGNKF